MSLAELSVSLAAWSKSNGEAIFRSSAESAGTVYRPCVLRGAAARRGAVERSSAVVAVVVSITTAVAAAALAPGAAHGDDVPPLNRAVDLGTAFDGARTKRLSGRWFRSARRELLPSCGRVSFRRS